MKKKASRQISVRFNRRLIWRKSGQFKWRLTKHPQIFSKKQQLPRRTLSRHVSH